MSGTAQSGHIILDHQSILWTDGLGRDRFVQTSQCVRLVLHTVQTNGIVIQLDPIAFRHVLERNAYLRLIHEDLPSDLFRVRFRENSNGNFPLQMVTVGATVGNETFLLQFENARVVSLVLLDDGHQWKALHRNIAFDSSETRPARLPSDNRSLFIQNNDQLRTICKVHDDMTSFTGFFDALAKCDQRFSVMVFL